MTLKWYQTADIVERESDISRQKTDSLLDRLATQSRLRKEEMARDKGQAVALNAQVAANFARAYQRASAADEIDEANRKLQLLGVTNQIPISESSIKQQIMSGRAWADTVVRQVEQATEQDRMDDLRKEAEKWAKWELKQVGGNWANLNPDDQEASIDLWFNKLQQPEEVSEETPEVEPITEIPKEGIDIGEGLRVMPNNAIIDERNPLQPLGYINPETGEIKTYSDSAGQKIRSFFSGVWKSIPLNPFYWMTPEQQRISDYKNTLVNWATSHNITNPEDWVNLLMEKPTKDLAIGPITEEELKKTLPLPTMPPEYIYNAPQLGLGTPLTKGEQFIGEWVMPILTLAMLPAAGQVSQALQPAVQAGGVTGGVAKVAQIALKPLEAFERIVGYAPSQITRRIAGKAWTQAQAATWADTEALIQKYTLRYIDDVLRANPHLATQATPQAISHIAGVVDSMLKQSARMPVGTEIVNYYHQQTLPRLIKVLLEFAEPSKSPAMVTVLGSIGQTTEAIAKMSVEQAWRVVVAKLSVGGAAIALTKAADPEWAATKEAQELFEAVGGIEAPEAAIPQAVSAGAATEINSLKTQLAQKEISLERAKLFTAPDKSEILAQERMITYLKDSIKDLEAGVTEGIPMPPEVQQQLLAQGEVLLQQVPEVLPSHLHTIGIPEGEAFVRTDTQSKPLIVGESHMREGQLTLGNIVSREKGLASARALIDVGKYIKENNIAFPPRSEMSPEAIKVYDKLQAVKPTATAVETTTPETPWAEHRVYPSGEEFGHLATYKTETQATRGAEALKRRYPFYETKAYERYEGVWGVQYRKFAETTALAEGGTVTSIIPEGVVTVEGLEPVKAIRNLQSQWATKKLQYEDARKQLTEYAKANLPKEVQGKMLSAVKNVKTETDLTKAIAQADKYAEQAAQKTLTAQIISELRRIKPAKAAGMRYGRFTAETQRQLNEIKANTNLERENVKAEILKNIEAAEEGKMPFEVADEANEILQVSGLKGMSSDELAYTLREVQSLKATGRGLRAAEREAELERITKVREDVIASLTGGKGIKPSAGTIDTRDMWAREGKPKSFLTNWQYGMDDILDKLSRFDKASEPFQSPLSQLGFNLHTSRSIQQLGVINWVDGKTASKVQEIYGVKGRRELNSFLGRLIREKISLGTFANTEGQSSTLSLTKDQIIQKYLELQDPTLDETFRIGMKWTDEMINAVKDSMTAEDLQYATWLSNQYVQNYGKTIKPVFENKYHIPFPENPKYVPLNRDLEASYYEHILTAQNNYRYAGVTNNSLKARVRNRIPLRFNGATQVWVRHVIQMEHFKAFATSMKEARMVFGNTDVRTAIRQYHGQDILSHLDRHLNDIARDGIDRALIVGGVDKLRGHFTLAALGVKIAVSFKQALSLPAYLTYQPMPIKDFFTGVADFYKHPMASIKEMKELSGYFSERWGRGHERDVRLVKEKDVAGRLSNSKNWRDLLMLGIHKVDTAVTQPGAWSVYQSMKKQKIPNAITHAEIATKRSQPSFGLEDMAALRKHGSFGKLFTMFQSQPNKYYRLIADSARNLKAGRGSKGRNTLNILLAWWVLPMMFQLVSDAFQWKKEHQMRVAILGPANYLLAAGQILQSAYGWITDEPFPAEASPIFSTLRELQYAITGTVNLLEQGRDPLKDVDTDYLVRTIEHYAKGIGQIVGIPTPYAVQVERAIRNADIRQMIFSQYALKNEGDAVKALQDSYAQAYGYNKWSDLPPEQQDRFYELRPDLK